jgi:hypothetical protein
MEQENTTAAVERYLDEFWDPNQATDREAWMYHLLRRAAETVLASTP